MEKSGLSLSGEYDRSVVNSPDACWTFSGGAEYVNCSLSFDARTMWAGAVSLPLGATLGVRPLLEVLEPVYLYCHLSLSSGADDG